MRDSEPCGSDGLSLAHRLACAVAPLAAVALVLMLVWGADRGYDITDEGIYLLECTWAPVSFSSFGAMAHAVFGWADPSVVGWRGIRLALTLGSALVFGYGLVRWLTRAYPSLPWPRAMRTSVLATAVVGALLSYGQFAQSLSYNAVNNALLLIGAGFALAAVASREDGRGVKAESWLLAAAGALVGWQVFVKWPAAVATAVALHVLIWATCDGWASRARRTTWFGLGASFAAVVFFVGVTPLGDWLAATRRETAMLTSSSHSAGPLLRYYARDVVRTALGVAGEYWPFLVAALVTAMSIARDRSRRSGRSRRTAVAATVAIAAFVACVLVSAHWRFGMFGQRFASRPYLALLAALGLVALVLIARERPSMRDAKTWVVRRGAVVAFLLVLPIAGAAGTGHPLSIQVPQHAAPWAALCALAVVEISLATASRLTWGPATLVPVALAATQAVHGYLWQPFRMRENLFEQSERIERAPGVRGLRVSPPVRVFLDDLSTAAQAAGLRDGDPVLAFHDIAGLVHAVGARSPGASFFWAPHPDRSIAALRSITDADRARAFLFLENRRPDVAATVLVSAGFDFPGGYEQVALVPNPYFGEFVAIWRPRRVVPR